MRIPILLLLGVVVSVAPPATAEEPKGEANLDISEMIAQVMVSGPGGSAEEGKPFADFKEVTKDMVSKEGMFTLWHYPSSASDKDQEKLLCQIPASFLGEQFMLSTSFSGGGFFTGFPLDERVVKWEMLDRQLLLVEPQTSYVVKKSSDVSDVVERTYPDRIRVAVPILTKSPSGDPVIDLGALLKSDFADIGWMSMASFFGQFGGSGGINSSLSTWTKKKTFPQNVEIGVALAVGSYSPPGSYDKKLVHYSFWKLPDTGYSPRIADDRVGYFMTTNQDWSKPNDSRDIFNRYVDRWQLEKRDPSLDKCEPKQPIVFYIEKTVPVRFRHAVRDGILEWNKAFEKVGFLNAVEVRQQTDDNEWKNLDPEDMRYSFFRWIVTGAGFAMGPHRSNPFTGQIYDADIIFDDSMVRYFEREATQMLPSAAMALKTQDMALEAFLEKCPQWKRPVAEWESFVFAKDKRELELRKAVQARLREQGCHFCDYADGMKHQMAMGRIMLARQPKDVVDRFLYDMIKEVVMHEVGHTLGLRHNFKASAIYSVEEIRNRRKTGEATTGSVMDYNPALLFGQGATEGHFVTPTLGPYDLWAIEYGYRPFDGSYKGKEVQESQEAPEQKEAPAAKEAPVAEVAAKIELSDLPPEVLAQIPDEIKEMIKSGDVQSMMAKMGGDKPSGASKSDAAAFRAPVAGEEEMLREIAARSTEPQLAYATDEDTTFMSPDPTSNRFDSGADPVEWAQCRIALVDARMKDLLDWAVDDKESWYHLRSTFQTLMFEKLQVLDYVGRYIGGQYFSRAHRGEAPGQAPFKLVEPEKQRRAMQFIEETLLSDDYFRVSPELLNHLAPSRWWHEGTSISFTMDYPIHNIISLFQWWNMFDRLFPNTLRRIHDAEMKTDAEDKLTLAEYIQRMQSGCWHDTLDTERLKGGTWSDASPFVSDIRRSLQREYLGVMEPLVRSSPGYPTSPDIQAMLKQALRTLNDRLTIVSRSDKIDFASRAHVVECMSRIERMLSPELDEYGF